MWRKRLRAELSNADVVMVEKVTVGSDMSREKTQPNPMGIDWTKVEELYRASILSLRAIGSECNVSHEAIRKHAEKEGWQRDLAPKVRRAAKRKLLEAAAKANSPKEADKVTKPASEVDNPIAREKEIVEAAARLQVDVIHTHRRDVARLAKIGRELARKLVDVIEGRKAVFEVPVMKGGKATGEKRVYFPFLGENESLSDALVKISRALKELVVLERKAFAIDEKEDNPEKARDMVPLEERLAQYRREEAMAEAGNVVEFSQPD